MLGNSIGSPFQELHAIACELLDSYPRSLVLEKMLDDERFRSEIWSRTSPDLRNRYAIIVRARDFLTRWGGTL